MSARALRLPLAAVVLVVLVLGVQVAAGGADYEPRRAADPCRERPAARVRPALEPLAERVVLVGLDETACKLRVSRERLALALASPRDRRALGRERGTDERGLARELKAGLGRGVDRLDRRGQLPAAAALLPSAADQLDVPEAARPLIGLLPDATVNDLAPTGAVLRRSLAKLDVDTLLAGLNDPGRLEPALRDAVVQGAREEIKSRVAGDLGGGSKLRLP